MTKNWKTNLGGAISLLGTSLLGVGILPQIGGANNPVLWWIALVGFILKAIGEFLTALFAADATAMNNIAAAVDKINMTGSDPGSGPAVESNGKPMNK